MLQRIPNNLILHILSAAYASSLAHFICQTQPKLWIHGHTHHSWNYRVGATQVICNPRGYPGEFNPAFEPSKILDII